MQDYTDNCFATDHAVQTDMQNMENNFAALKSAFSGATTPSDTVAGMWWFDTTANILKLRNEANNDWQSVWDFANNKPVITNLSAEITGAMIAAALKDPAVGTAGLRTLGTGALTACAGNDARLSDTRTPPDNGVTLAKMQHGSIMLPFYMDQAETAYECDLDAYTVVATHHVYIPTDATSLKMAARIKNENAERTTSVIFTISTASLAGTRLAATYDWVTLTKDVSVLDGWYDMTVSCK